jgi:carboxylesterase
MRGGEPIDLAGDRRGVLLLHGFTGTPFEMRPLGEALHRDVGATVLGPVLAGHGETVRALVRTTWRDWETSAAGAFDRLAVRCDRVIVAGLSMGGLLALRLALSDRPVAGLVLMGVPLWFGMFSTGLVRVLDGAGVDLPIPKLFGSDVRDRTARVQTPSYRQLPVRGVAQLIELAALVRADLPRVGSPSLIVHGRHDHTASPDCAVELSRRLGSRDVALRWLERSYHLLPIDVERAELARLAAEFVRKHGGGS